MICQSGDHGFGFYFSAFPQQRTRVDPASEASFLPRSFNPAKGNVLYIGLIGKRPAVWKKQLEEMQEKASEGVTAGSKTAGPNAQRARDLLLASRSLLSMTAGPSHNPELEKQAAQMGYEQTRAGLEKMADDAYTQGWNDTVEAVYKTAAVEFMKAAQITSNMVEQYQTAAK